MLSAKFLSITCFIFINFCTVSLFAQTEEEQVKLIRDRFQQINSSLSSYQSIEKEISGESTEGASIKAYHDNGETVLLHCRFYGETGNITEDYYFYNSTLFFVYSVKENYSSGVQEGNPQVLSKEENRYYFNDGKLIRWIKQKNAINKSEKAFAEAEASVIKEAYRLIDVFNKH